jgi:isoleucyl-tRNA synthetase
MVFSEGKVSDRVMRGNFSLEVLEKQAISSQIIMPDDQQKSTTPDFNKLEQDILEFWKKDNTFQKSLEKTKDGEPFIFYDGPPFATGLPHYGSILPSVIKDAIPRYQTMRGRFVRRRWGWDCHGLPIENIVEQHLKISGKKQIEEIGVARFNQVCRDNVLTYAREWGKVIDRIARWVEFDNAYMTMQTSYMESVWWALKQTWDKGLIYEDRKVLLYCSRCETPISNFEVAMDNSYRDVTEESVYVKFKLLPRQRIVDFLTDDKTYALAWTTTPWTLPGNTALNVGPDIKYVIVEQDGAHYILAKELLPVIGEDYEIKLECTARSLEGLSYEPLYSGVIPNSEGRAHKIYAADFVTTEDGTGIVHNAAMYGEDDYQLAKDKDLPRVDMLDHKGQYLDVAPEHLRGKFFKDADKIVLKNLQDKGLVYKTQSYTHSYPHCYRCGTPLFYNALPAWFINVQKVKSQLIELNKDINWYPEHLKFGRFQQGIENAPDWNISRNRYWATALPFWKCQNETCKDVICVGSIEELQQRSTNFAEVYPQYDPADLEKLDLHKPYIDQIKLKCEKCSSEMQRVPEVVDCWVESGSMPFAELHYPFENTELFKQRFPSDFVVEYIPQTRAWFYVMHVMNTILQGAAPFRNVMTTGTILGEDGTKMSKSKGNYPDANIVIEKYGADALRFYLLTSPVVTGEDVSFSEKTVAETARRVNMLLYNVWSFYRTYTQSKIDDSVVPDESYVLDRWILARLQQTHALVTKDLDAYTTVRAGRAIMEFINDLSTWYLRRSRDRLRGLADAAGDADNSGQSGKNSLAVFGYVLAETAKMLALFTPFLAEFLYQDLTGKDSVHLQNWTAVNEKIDETVLAQMAVVREAVSAGHALRKTLGFAVRQPLRALDIIVKSGESSAKVVELDQDLIQLILDELNVKVQEDALSDKAQGRAETIKSAPGTQHIETLYLDIELTPELKLEGVARELERQVQDLRKKSGLKVGEIVDLYYNTPDESLAKALVELLDRKKTFVNQIQMSFEVEVDNEAQAKVNGEAIWLGIIKV